MALMILAIILVATTQGSVMRYKPMLRYLRLAPIDVPTDGSMEEVELDQFDRDFEPPLPRWLNPHRTYFIRF